MKRRKFLFASLGAVSAVGAAGGGAAYWRSDCTPFIVAVLKRELHYLSMDESDLQRFAGEFAANSFDNSDRAMWRAVSSVIQFFPTIDSQLAARQGKRYRHLKDRIVTSWLWSTDFFYKGMDESLPLQYIGFATDWAPLDRPCSNPFSQFYLSA